MKYILPLFLAFSIVTISYAQWSQTEGPEGGICYKIVEINKSIITLTGGRVFKSSDRGESWKLCTNGLPQITIVYFLLVHDKDIYVSVNYGGVYRSQDEGESWELANKGIENGYITSLYGIGNKIFAASSNKKVYYSNDNGNKWVEKSTGLTESMVYDFTFFDTKIYAAGEQLFVSDTSDGVWNRINMDGVNARRLRSLAATENVLYASDGQHLFTNKNSAGWKLNDIFQPHWSINHIKVSADSVYVTSGDGSIFYTTNDGDTWTRIQKDNTEFILDAILAEDAIYFATDQGIFQTKDKGKTWMEKNDALKAMNIKGIESYGSYLYTYNDQKGIFRSPDNGDTWENIWTGLPEFSFVNGILKIGNELLLAAGIELYTSKNNGSTWEAKSTLATDFNKSIYALAFDNGILAAAVNTHGIYLSLDTGATWNLTNTENLNLNTGYTSLLLKGDTILLGTAGGEIFISESLGRTWRKSTNSNSTDVRKFLFIDKRLYVATYQGVFTSDDLGLTWKALSKGLGNATPYDLQIVGERLYLGTDKGVYLSGKDRENWIPANTGLNEAVTRICISGETIFAGTYYHSTWSAQLSAFNLTPVITGTSDTLHTLKDTPLAINLTDIKFTDPDTKEASSFALVIMPGNNYTVNGSSITPANGFIGKLTVPITLSDGKGSSEIVNLSVEVMESTITSNERDLATSFSLYPNPSTGIVNILIENGYFGRIDIAILDCFGRPIEERTFTKEDHILQKLIDLGKDYVGVYICVVKLANGSTIYKKLIMK